MSVRIGRTKVSAIIKSAEQKRGRFWFRVVDYDGTMLQEAWLNKGDKIKLVASPTHEGLVFQEWSSPVAINNNEITMPNSDVTIGPTYTTSSGLSEFYITLTAVTGLSMTLNIDGTKDWGDGTVDTSKTHTYASAGDYKITCDGSTMDTCTSSSNLFGMSSDDRVTKIHLVNCSSIGAYVFYTCRALECITIAKGATLISDFAFYATTGLKAIILPSGVTTIGTYGISFAAIATAIVLPLGITAIGEQALRYCYGLESITLPEGLTSLGAALLRDCLYLRGITIPSSITSLQDAFARGCTYLNYVIIEGNISIGTNAFYSCNALNKLEISGKITNLGGVAFYKCIVLDAINLEQNISDIGSRTFYYNANLKSLRFKGNVSSIAAEAFFSCFNIKEYDFSECTVVPTLANVNAFSGINGLCKIKVPKSLESEWKAATNWSTYANYIVGV